MVENREYEWYNQNVEDMNKLELRRMIMKEYKIFSKVIILVCLCLLFATILNFFTGVINSTMPGSSHVLCAVICSGVISWTVAQEKRRINELK